jgi:hypothetical protein
VAALRADNHPFVCQVVLQMSGASYRLGETSVKVGTGWKYLSRAETKKCLLIARN